MVNSSWLIEKNNLHKKAIAICLLMVGIFLLSNFSVYAQSFPSISGVATNVEVADKDAVVGDILSVTKDGLKRSSAEYDITMLGVISASPVISVEPKTDKTKAVVSSGQVEVRVSAKGGAIAIGDFVTTSSEAGVGQKATKPGYVLGKALGKYEDTSKVGLISVSIEIGNNGGGGGAGPGAAGLLNIKDTLANSKFVLAAIAGVIAFLAAAFAFVKFMTTGLEAIGRNPMAKKTILVGMVLSGSVVVTLALAGVGIVVAIIRLK